MIQSDTEKASTPSSQDGPEVAVHTPTPWFHRQAGETSPRTGDPYDWIADSPERGKHRKIIVSRYSCEPADYAFIVKAVNNHDAMVKRIAQLESDLLECREFIDDYVDVVDGDDGPRPNRAMSLVSMIDETLNGRPY